MQVFNSLLQWQQFRAELPQQSKIGFAPTMGNLHAGHASLFHASQQENDITVSSLFVNPTQFNRADDFNKYPRTLEDDLIIMQEAGVNYCIIPDEQSMYHDNYRYQIQENDLSQIMEGQYRPGHFNGVLTVVMKLLNLVQPTVAYFGEKDYQQYQLIKAMVDAFFMPVCVKACPTVREKSGLAYSSRNNRLNQEQRALAERFAAVFHQSKPCAELIKELEGLGVQVDYLQDYQQRRYAAVLIGDIRLIDNYALP